MQFRQKIGTNFRLITIEGFDELFTAVDRRLAGESLNPQLPSQVGMTTTTGTSPDSRPCNELSLEDLDRTLLRGVIEEHYRRINNSEIRDFEAHLLEYDFASRVDSRIVPHLGLWLLFGKDVTNKLPYLKSILRIGDREQRVIEGNLVSQFNEIRQVLLADEINPTLRIKKATLAEEKRAYHPRALLELLVNHFVHRDYSIEEPCEIHVQPGTSITFKTVGGLPFRTPIGPKDPSRFCEGGFEFPATFLRD